MDDVAGMRRNSRLVVGVRERDGSTLYLDPAKEHAPHTLIAGTTGSGKSVLHAEPRPRHRDDQHPARGRQ
jgi:hypothetical protein